MSQEKYEISFDSTVTRASKSMTQSGSTVLVTRREKNLGDLALTRRACDSDSTKGTRAHHCHDDISSAVARHPSTPRSGGTFVGAPQHILY